MAAAPGSVAATGAEQRMTTTRMTNSNPAAALTARDRAAVLDDGELLVAWDGMVCGSTPDRLADALHLLGRPELQDDEAGNIEELRDLNAAVWEEIATRRLVERTAPESRYDDDPPGVGGSVERREDLALLG